MKYMLIDNDELYTFEAAEEDAINIARENILNHHLYGMHIMDVKVIKDNLKLNFGEFEVDVTVTTGKTYPFQILPDPNTFIDRLVNTVNRYGIRDAEETMKKVNDICTLVSAWEDAIIENDSHMNLIDETPLFDIMDKADEISRKQFEDTDKEIGILIDECEKKYGLMKIN